MYLRKGFPLIQNNISVYHEMTIVLYIYSGHNDSCLLYEPKQMKHKKAQF